MVVNFQKFIIFHINHWNKVKNRFFKNLTSQRKVLNTKVRVLLPKILIFSLPKPVRLPHCISGSLSGASVMQKWWKIQTILQSLFPSAKSSWLLCSFPNWEWHLRLQNDIHHTVQHYRVTLPFCLPLQNDIHHSIRHHSNAFTARFTVIEWHYRSLQHYRITFTILFTVNKWCV